MISVTAILGDREDPSLAPRIQALEDRDCVDILNVSGDDAFRRRMRLTSTGGRDIAISLPRDEKVFNGAVLKLDDELALVVELEQARWLRITPQSKADGLVIGHQAGHLHWKVRFDNDSLLVRLESSVQDYLVRLRVYLDDSRFSAEETVEVPES